MKQYLLFGFLLIFTFSTFSQNSKFSIEANYPITIDNNFLGDDSYGIVDLGLKYRFAELNPIKIGVSLNGGVLIDNSNQNNSPQDFLVTTYIIQPKVFAELNVESVEKLHPFLGLGYKQLINEREKQRAKLALFQAEMLKEQEHLEAESDTSIQILKANGFDLQIFLKSLLGSHNSVVKIFKV